MILGGLKTSRVLAASFRMVRRNFRRFTGYMLMVNLLLVLVVGLVLAASFISQAPQIALVGHRGGPSQAAIENTLEAVEHSIAQGAYYVEVDIQRTKDGHNISTTTTASPASQASDAPH